MPGPSEPSRVILDPSIIFTDEAREWIADPELRPWLAVSEALMRRIERGESGETFRPYAEPSPGRVAELREMLQASDVMVYSLEQALSEGALSDGARLICERLVNSDESLGDVLADEWAFLTSQSLAALRERAKHALDAFRRAGAEVYEVAADTMRGALEQLRGPIPDPVLDAMKDVARIKNKIPPWLALGGAVATLAVAIPPHLGLGIHVVEAVAAGVAVIAGDP